MYPALNVADVFPRYLCARAELLLAHARVHSQSAQLIAQQHIGQGYLLTAGSSVKDTSRETDSAFRVQAYLEYALPPSSERLRGFADTPAWGEPCRYDLRNSASSARSHSRESS